MHSTEYRYKLQVIYWTIVEPIFKLPAAAAFWRFNLSAAVMKL